MNAFPQSTADFSANYREAFADACAANGTTPADYADLPTTQKDKVALAAAHFVSANPAYFSATQVRLANNLLGAGVVGSPVSDYDLGDAVADFTGEAINQAQQINPFSTLNRTTTLVLAVGVVLAAVVAYSYAAGGKLPTPPK